MLGYAGEMTSPHLRAAIRAAFAARGFDELRTRSSSTAAERWFNGVRLRERIGTGVGETDARRFQEKEPDVWERIPLIADLGFRQTSLFQSMTEIPTRFADEAATLGAAFNVAITMIDRAVDEKGAGDRLFHVLDASLMRNIFLSPDLAVKQLGAVLRESGDIRERFLYKLVAYCASTGYLLFVETRNKNAWQDLGETVALTLEGEKVTSSGLWLSCTEARRILPYVQAKSCLPSVVALHVALLAHEPSVILARDLAETAKWLGNLFWYIDDLTDLLDDLRTGTPNVILLRLADRLTAEGRRFASDTDIYDEVDLTADELMKMLSAAPPADVKHHNAAGWFAATVIAGWTDSTGVQKSFQPVADAGAAPGKALRYLIAQQSDGFSEAIHHLTFPRLLDGEVRYETRPSLLSHRAVILDALLDADEAGMACPHDILAAETMAILRSKHRDVRGGWSYIQEAPELPPDADDLGQVLQVLTRFGGQELASICDEAIRLVLDSSEDDGSFCTWILDPRGASFVHQRMQSYLDVMGGWGIHPEVVANLLFGLWLYDPVRYRESLHRSVRYLEAVQEPEGYWKSKWYTGPFYGTWRVVSVLSRIAPASDGLRRSQQFLLSTANAGGGWGEHGTEPLSTALAMLALCSSPTGRDTGVLSAGLARLNEAQGHDGAWPSYPWIYFPTIDGVVNHGSASITTAFCLKATLAASRVLGQQGTLVANHNTTEGFSAQQDRR